MNHKIETIKEGVLLHSIETKKFKNTIIAIFITVPLTRENVTKDALINLILRRGSKNFETQEKINKELEELYGAVFDCGLDKSGDNHVFKFYIECINDKYLENDNEVLKNCIKILSDIVFNPVTENGEFNSEYFEAEKEKLEKLIASKIDNKDTYAFNRCIEEMYKEKKFGLYKYGYKSDLGYIQNTDLYERYEQIVNTGKIDIFLSGNVGEEERELIRKDENISKLENRAPIFNIEDGRSELTSRAEVKEIFESMKVMQGKIVIGLNISEKRENTSFVALIYNAILGGTANSKLFQNVREKQSLAYTAGSKYIKPKNNIFIKCGIDIKNYDKAVETIKEQLEDMKNGNFSEEDIANAKNIVLAIIKGMADEQDTIITYYLGQELSYERMSLQNYAEEIANVNKKDIVSLANKINIDTIYFLKD